VEPEKDPSTYGDLMAGTKGSLATPTGIPPAVYMSTVFHVTADSADRLLLKLKSFGDYTGQGFGTGVPCSGLLFETYSAAYLPGLYLQYGNAKTHTVRIQSPMGTYGVPYFVVTQGTTEGLTVGDLRVTGDRLSSYQVGYCRTELTYRPVAQPNTVETDIRAAAYEYYLTLDGETAAYLQTLIAEMGWDGSDPAVIPAVADYLRSHCPLAVANEYDTSLDGADNVVLAFLQSPTEVTSRHLAAAATLIYRALGIPARYTVGYLVEAPAGETVTVTGNHAYAWAEVYVNGFGWCPVDVALRDSGENDTFEVTLKPENMAVRYNGETVEHSGVLTGFEAYEEKGYYYEAQISGKRRGCGHTYVTIDSVTIFNKSGADVTHLFDITLEAGDLFVYLEELWFSSVGASKVYDGTPLTAAEAALVSGILPEGYFAEIIPAQGQTVVGTGIAAFEVKIWYDSGNGKPVDRTSNYFLIHKAYGTLTVTPAALTVKAADAQKVYDGEALTAPSIEIVGGALAEGDYVDSYTVEGSRTEVGRSENNITALIIRNKDGADVTRSYAIDLQAGILRVTED
jgi:hypothetical protein